MVLQILIRLKFQKKNKILTNIDVWQGKKKEVGGYIKEDVYKTIPKARKKYLKVVVNYKGPVEAPIKKNEQIGELSIFYKDELIDKYNLLASENIKKINIFSRLINSINFLIWGDV